MSDPTPPAARSATRRCWWLIKRGVSLVPPRESLLLVIFALYLHVCVEMRLVFWNQNDLFLGTFRFARDFLVAPGQPCQWLGKLLLQSCYFGWPGAVVVAAVVGALLLAARSLFSSLEPQPRVQDTWLIPGVLLVVLHSQYAFRLSATLGLVLALAASAFYVRLPRRGFWAGLAVFVLAGTVVYYVTGAAYFVFAACCLVDEVFVAARRLRGLALLVLSPLLKFAVDGLLSQINQVWLHGDPPEATYLVAGGSLERSLLAVLYAYYPACALVLATRKGTVEMLHRLWRRGTHAELPATESTPGQTPPVDMADPPSDRPAAADRASGSQTPGMRWMWRWILVPVLVVLMALAGVKLSNSREIKTILELDDCASHRLWGQVLQHAKYLPRKFYSGYAEQDVNAALYHTGRLPYEMFRYPQSRLFADHGFGSHGRLLSRKACDLLLDLGRVNEAETIAHEDLEYHLSTEMIRRLVTIKLVKGQVGVASLYLSVLRDDLVSGRWAEDYLERLRADPNLCEPQIVEIRSRMITQDDAYLTHKPEADGSASISAEKQLLSLLEQNPRNRMAFEYLMAIHLLNKNLTSLVAQLPQLDAFAYSGTPLLYEQAAILYAAEHPEKLVLSETGAAVNGCPISAETVRNCARLQEIRRACGRMDQPAAKAAVARELGGTYFYYYFYGSQALR